MRAAIAILRARTSPQRSILVYHIDLPANDFSTLFDVLESDPDSYVVADPNAFPSAIGRSFYRSVLPPNHADLAWSSYAAQWLSQIPRRIPNHFYIPCSTGGVRAAFDHQAAVDWEKFLSLRATELRPGGRLVVALPAVAEDGSTPFAMIMDHANAVISELVVAGVITAEEREQMILPACARRKSDLLAPFARDGQFQRLVVEHCSTSVVPDTAWSDYQLDKDVEAFARKRVQFFRATFVPSLALALAPHRTADERRTFASRLEAGLSRRIAADPVRIDHPVGMIVLAKQVRSTRRRFA